MSEFSRRQRRRAAVELEHARLVAIEARDSPSAAAVIAYFAALEAVMFEQALSAEDADLPKIMAAINANRRAIDALYPSEQTAEPEEGRPKSSTLDLDGQGAVY